MSSTRIKDYYGILEVPPAAGPEQIKKAYRRLALLYHPDKNPGNAFAEARFRELQEAYATLSHHHRRQRYDEERWLSGQFNDKTGATVTPESILKDSRKLSRHLSSIDVHRMNHEVLYEIIALLLSDEHMGLLSVQASEQQRNDIATELLNAARYLHHPFLEPALSRLSQLSDNANLRTRLHRLLQEEQQRHRWHRAMPWLIALITLLLCLLLFLAGRR